MKSRFTLGLAILLTTAIAAQAAVEMPAASYIAGLKWLGHASFQWVRGGVTVYFDPWKIKSSPHDADILLISHPHFDHLDTADVAKLVKANTVIVTPAACAEKLKQAHISGDIRVVKPGDVLTVKGAKIEVVPAYNTDKIFHLKQNQWVGFIVELNGTRLYHAGDTDFIPEMNLFKVDVALLPVSGTYVMTAEEAAHAAQLLAPRVAIPMHYGSIVGSAADAKRFQSLCSGLVVEILKKEDL